MSDDKPKTDGELDLDWDDALADWEKDLDGDARAENAPIPQTPGEDIKKGSAAPGRALYRPPSAEDVEKMRARDGRGQRQTAPPPPAKGPVAPPVLMDDHVSFADDDDDGGSTRVASLDEDLVARLRAVGEPAPEPARNSAVDLDLDGLLEGLDGETQHYPAEIPRVLRASRPPTPPPATAPATEPPQALPRFAPKPPMMSASSPPVPAPPIPGGARPPAAARLAAAAAKLSASRASPVRPPAPVGARPGMPAAPRVPPPGGVPLPGGVPRPGLVVAPPKPAQAAPAAAGAPKAAITDRLGALRKPIASPLAASARGALPAPPIAAPPLPAPPLPAPEANFGADIDAMLGGLDLEPLPAAPAPAPPKSAIVSPSRPPAPQPDAASPIEVAESAAEEAFFTKSRSVLPPPPDVAPEIDAFAMELRELEAGARDAAVKPAPAPFAPEPIGGLDTDDEISDGPLPVTGAAAPASRVGVSDAGADVVITSDGDADVVITSDGDDEAVTISDDGDVTVSEADGEAEYGDADEASTTIIAGDDDEPVDAPAPRVVDRGAAAARRSVRSRRPRVEVFPLVGRAPENHLARADLLERIAQSTTGAAKASALLAAAELRAAAGRGADREEDQGASLPLELEAAALEAAPTDLVALRLARVRATQRREWPVVAALYEREAAASSIPTVRALAWAAASAVHLSAGSTSKVLAERAAEAAAKSDPGSVPAALLLATLHASAGRASEADAVLSKLASGISDGALSEALGVAVAARASLRGATDEALASARGGATAAFFARARANAASAPKSAADELTHVREPPAIVESAARLATIFALRSGDAVAALAHSRAPQSLAALRTAAQAARRAGDKTREREILAAWSARSGGTERATALGRVAELSLEDDDMEAAEQALRGATLADPELGTLRVLRNEITRRDPARAFSEGAEPALVLAAKIALDPASAAAELELLEKARDGTESVLLADVLSLDALAAAGDPVRIRDALTRQSERLEPDARVGTLLSLAERAAAADDAIAILRDGLDHAPGTLIALRALARIAAPAQAAVTWLEEASVLSGDRAAFAATRGAMLAEAAGEDGTAGYRRALEAVPRYLPALWGLARAARAAGDPDAIEEVEDRLADASSRPIDVAAHRVRAGLARATVDPAAAGEHLRRAREAAPDDLVLLSLSLRLGEGMSLEERAQRLVRATADATGEWRRAFAAHAAIALEAAGDLAGAAELLRTEAGIPGASSALDRVELALGQHARVAERRLAAARAAVTDEERVRALEALARIDLEREDPSAVLSLQAVVAVDGRHMWALRALERHFMLEGREDELCSLAEQLSGSLADPADVATYVRLATRLLSARPDATGQAADALVLSRAGTARVDLWLSRRLAAAARAAGDDATAAQAETAIASRLEKPLERASIAMRAAEIYERIGDVATAAAVLADPCEASEDHPLAWEMRARLLEASADLAGASRAWEMAAVSAMRPDRKVGMLRRAAVLAQDELSDEDRAVALLTAACDVDVAYEDVFERLEALLRHRNDLTALSALLDKRLAVGGDATALVSMHRAQAKLKEAQGDREGARAALRAALELAPDDLDALKRAAELSLEDGDFRAAAESLIRIARLRKDRDELRWVFFTLGDIYDRHIPDLKRAEAAFKRVLKLAPDDIASMERLAALYLREGPREAAIAQLEELAKIEPDIDRSRNVRLQLAQVLEESGDARRAEQVLEITRRAAPTELATLRAMADFYGRQRAQSALAMHLNRAVNDFRGALGTDLADEAAWLGLVEVFGWRGRPDAARAAASAAAAIGVVDVEVARLLDEGGGVPGAHGRAFDETLEDVLSPAGLTPAHRAVFRTLGGVLEKVLPFDPKLARAEKVPPRDATIRPLALEVARWLGLTDIDVWVSSGAPRVCIPVTGSPVGVMIGRDLLLGTDDREKRFLLARALKLATSQLSLPVRVSQGDLLGLFAGLLLAVDPQQPTSLDPAMAQDWAKRVTKQVPRRSLDEVASLVFELAGAPPADIVKMTAAVYELGARAALLSTGSVPAAVSALVKLAHDTRLPAEPVTRVAAFSRVPGVAQLVAFSIADAYFDLRARSGADRA